MVDWVRPDKREHIDMFRNQGRMWVMQEQDTTSTGLHDSWNEGRMGWARLWHSPAREGTDRSASSNGKRQENG